MICKRGMGFSEPLPDFELPFGRNDSLILENENSVVANVIYDFLEQFKNNFKYSKFYLKLELNVLESQTSLGKKGLI